MEQGRKTNATCCICGKEFYLRPCTLKKEKYGHCCSRECGSELKRRIAPLCNPSHVSVLKCQYCGKEFKTYSINQKYCSNECFCKSRYKGKTVCGIGINDIQGENKENIKVLRNVWCAMLKRCYYKEYQKKVYWYSDCKVCNEWLLFSNFYDWAKDRYFQGSSIDKDILSDKNNRIYSPETCCFIPKEVNNSIVQIYKSIFDEKCGIYYHDGKYYPNVTVGGKTVHLGVFSSKREAISIRKSAKKLHMLEVVERNKNKIEERAYNRLIEKINMI